MLQDLLFPVSDSPFMHQYISVAELDRCSSQTGISETNELPILAAKDFMPITHITINLSYKSCLQISNYFQFKFITKCKEAY